MENIQNNFSITRLIAKYKMHLLIIAVLAVVLSGIFSGPKFITPLYKSSAIVYPINLISYSNESETEQMMQLFHSNIIRDKMIKKYKLAEHYGIDSTISRFKTTVIAEYNDHITFKKTTNEAVEILVEDADPELACVMVNDLINIYNKTVKKIHNDRHRQEIVMYQNAINKKQKAVDSLKNILSELGTQYGLFNVISQSREAAKGRLGTLEGTSKSLVNKKEVDRLTNSLQKYSGQFIETNLHLEHEIEMLSKVIEERDEKAKFIYSDVSYSNTLSKPFVTDKKSYPVRWLIVLAVTIAALILALCVIFVIENKDALLGEESKK